MSDRGAAVDEAESALLVRYPCLFVIVRQRYRRSCTRPVCSWCNTLLLILFSSQACLIRGYRRESGLFPTAEGSLDDIFDVGSVSCTDWTRAGCISRDVITSS